MSVFLPMLSRTGDLGTSLRRSAPLVLIGMCTFIANDLDDIDTDQINHPERPLASGQLGPTLATVVYFACLTLALVSVKTARLPSHTEFLYFTLLTLVISYNYVVDYLPSVKPIYVGSVSAVPILIVASFYPEVVSYYFVAGATVLFVIGRELCMDFADRAGDRASRIQQLSRAQLKGLVLVIQGFAVLAMVPLIQGALGLLAVCALAILAVQNARDEAWGSGLSQSIRRMKLQMFVGLYFLI